MGDWKGFERLAERIVRDLRPDATVTLDDHLPGRFTEKKRLIDVSIRWTDSSHEQLWNQRAIPDNSGVRDTIQSSPLLTPVRRVDGQGEWRHVDLQVVYEVERRAWLGQFTPNQCRGLVDYLDDDAFTASHLPIGEIPTERNDQWVEIDDPDGVAVRIRGTLVTTIGYELAPGSFTWVETTVALPGRRPPERLPADR